MKTELYFIRYIKNDPKQMKEFYFHSKGTKLWYLNGELHRENGPAIEYRDGAKQWYLNGKRDHHKEMIESWKHWNSKGNIEFAKRLFTTAFVFLFFLAAIVLGFFLSFN